MKLIRFNGDRIGIIEPAGVRDVTALFDLSARWPLPQGDIVIRQLRGLLPKLAALADNASLLSFDRIKLDSPVANPGKIIGAPVNYKAHIDEANADAAINQGRVYTTLEAYGLFLKANSSLAGPSAPLRLTFPDRRTDHEVELAVVIGQEVRDIAEAKALEVVAGYTIGLDMSLRGKEVPSYRKSADGYSIVGPWLVTPDEIADPNNLTLSLSVNGEVRQAGSTKMQTLNVAQVIAYASRVYTLYPGDIIMTGTPSGVGPVSNGDVINAHVEGLGSFDISVMS